MKYILFTICFTLLIVLGCEPEDVFHPPPSVYDNDLVKDAEETFASRSRAFREGTKEVTDKILPIYWADGIKALNPIRVYTHRINIVVVQSNSNGIEEGKYINIPLSSYIPQTGDDGFVFDPNPRSDKVHAMGKRVYDFKRTLQD